MRETLDEAIDRVAATLTTVSPRSSVVERLDAQPERRRLQRAMRLALATASIVLVAVALIERRDRGESPAVVQSRVTAAPNGAESSLSPSIVSDLAGDVVDTRGAIGARRVLGSDLPPAPTIAALASPPALVVDDLQLVSPAVAPVEIVQLDDVPRLEVPALETTRLVEFR
jgi:hypothetical protein